MFRVILCASTNRVIFFTDDTSVTLRTTDHSYLAEFESVPKEMNLSNCWDYAYRNGKTLTFHGDPKPVTKTLFQTNLEEARNQLRKAIDGVLYHSQRNNDFDIHPKLTPETIREVAELRGITSEELVSEIDGKNSRHIECVNAAYFNFVKFTKLIDAATTSEQLTSVRDIFMNTKLSVKVKD